MGKRVLAILLLTVIVLMIKPAAGYAQGGYVWPTVPGMRLHYAGMVKPIEGLRNYDGTTDTQTPGYSVLWTGRYNTSCGNPIGEGTGGHPGVDIRATCGTSVRAIGEGRIIYSYWSWAQDNNRQNLECANNQAAGFPG